MTNLLPLGDQGALAYFADETAALRFAVAVRRHPPSGLVEVVPAYQSVAVFFDLEQTDFAQIEPELRRIAVEPSADSDALPSRLHRIPCCYELQLDMERVVRYVAGELQQTVSAEDVIRLHTGTEYALYAIGFCPGFPYLGYLPRGLSGVPRLEKPRVLVEPGSVGVAGTQTGVYTEAKPGGWNIIGRTPLELVNVADGYFPLRIGDRIRFERIEMVEFARLRGERL